MIDPIALSIIGAQKIIIHSVNFCQTWYTLRVCKSWWTDPWEIPRSLGVRGLLLLFYFLCLTWIHSIDKNRFRHVFVTVNTLWHQVLWYILVISAVRRLRVATGSRSTWLKPWLKTKTKNKSTPKSKTNKNESKTNKNENKKKILETIIHW